MKASPSVATCTHASTFLLEQGMLAVVSSGGLLQPAVYVVQSAVVATAVLLHIGRHSCAVEQPVLLHYSKSYQLKLRVANLTSAIGWGAVDRKMGE